MQPADDDRPSPPHLPPAKFTGGVRSFGLLTATEWPFGQLTIDWDVIRIRGLVDEEVASRPRIETVRLSRTVLGGCRLSLIYRDGRESGLYFSGVSRERARKELRDRGWPVLEDDSMTGYRPD